MPAFTVNRNNSYGVEIAVAFDAQWTGFEIWAPEVVREADVFAYYKKIVDSSDFINTAVGGFARKEVSFEDLKMDGSLSVYVRVVGIGTGANERLEDVTAQKITRSNSILEDLTVWNVDYPADPQIPFGFFAEELFLTHLAGAAIYGSYDGIVDHLVVDATNPTAEDETHPNVGLAQQIYLRADTSASGQVRVRARRASTADRR